MGEIDFCNTENNLNNIVILNEDIHCNFYITRQHRYCKLPLYPNYNYCSRHQQYELPLKRIEKPDECPVCVEKFEPNDKALKCGHWVHKQCIIKSGKSKCPICRFQIYLKPNELKECNNYAHIYRQNIHIHNFITTTLGDNINNIINSYPSHIRQHIYDVGIDNIIDTNNINSNTIEHVLREYIINSINLV